jgi:hypothetical protein
VPVVPLGSAPLTFLLVSPTTTREHNHDRQQLEENIAAVVNPAVVDSNSSAVLLKLHKCVAKSHWCTVKPSGVLFKLERVWCSTPQVFDNHSKPTLNYRLAKREQN